MTLHLRPVEGSDTPALQRFTCTTLRKPRTRRNPVSGAHDQRPTWPGWWEYEVQASARTLGAWSPGRVLVADHTDERSQGELGAVVHLSCLSPRAWVVELMAIHHGLRQQSHGQHVMLQVLTLIRDEARAARQPLVIAQGMVWWENHPSQALMARMGFERLQQADEAVQEWVIQIEA